MSTSSEYSGSGDDLRSAPRQPLPVEKNIDGRPIWEPPIFDYSHLIGQEYEKQREAVLKYTRSDVARTTGIMDAYAEMESDKMYERWLLENVDDCTLEAGALRFYRGLLEELKFDSMEAEHEFTRHRVSLKKNEDGKYRVGEHSYPPSRLTIHFKVARATEWARSRQERSEAGTPHVPHEEHEDRESEHLDDLPTTAADEAGSGATKRSMPIADDRDAKRKK